LPNLNGSGAAAAVPPVAWMADRLWAGI